VPKRFDALVVGAGPAGSIAALVLARAGASVALLDKASFPRDKACGDLVGPRGLQLLADLGVDPPPGVDVGDMVVLGPSGRRVRLPSAPGRTYPGHGRAVTRLVFDAALREAAVEAGAVACHARADTPLFDDGRLEGFRTGTGDELRSDVVVGADGATSRVAEVAGLVDPAKVLYGFAVRVYVDEPVELPVIALYEPAPWRALGGYGWLFPGPDGVANAGLGVATKADRRAGAEAVRLLPDFLVHLARLGYRTSDDGAASARRLGGWLKLGMVGTVPAKDRVLLVGDAAGLVNPLQGEGIAQAMASGRAAAEAVLAGPDGAAARYRAALVAAHLPYHRIAAAAHAAMVGRPRLVAAVGRVLTAPGLGPALAGGWAVFWNELLDGAPPGSDRAVAAFATAVGRLVTAPSGVSRWFEEISRPA